jgi:phenylacetate-coenzyme A ligase PaaK-like adenylate-forming protein
MQGEWNDKVFSLKEEDFEAFCLEVFRFQYQYNGIYQEYVNALRIDPVTVQSLAAIPFLPIRFFKTHAVQTTLFEPQIVFESSGTTGSINSRHLIKELSLYEESFTRGFDFFYGPVKEWCIIGLLPSYLERNNSSLVYMTDQLIRLSEHPQSGFYLDEHDKLFAVLQELEKRKQKTVLIGVTFALLDFAEKYSLSLKNTMVMETGGMKGRRKEMIRQEVHEFLQAKLGIAAIHSEYGMTELLSQAYSKGNGVFHCPPWMKILLRDEEDPLRIKNSGAGAINVIDPANIYSCSFIATDDVGRLNGDGSFEVLGRMDGSDLRGCSLMVV